MGRRDALGAPAGAATTVRPQLCSTQWDTGGRKSHGLAGGASLAPG